MKFSGTQLGPPACNFVVFGHKHFIGYSTYTYIMENVDLKTSLNAIWKKDLCNVHSNKLNKINNALFFIITALSHDFLFSINSYLNISQDQEVYKTT
jgi:hypothetical protein